MIQTSFITTNEVPLESSRIKKGRYLELATRRALEELRVSFRDTSRIYNGKMIGFIPLGRELANGKAPDFLVDYFLIECKNWSLSKYHIGLAKAKTEINSRASNFLFHQRILIISKDRFSKRAKQYLKNEGWIIIQLGFVVNRENLSEAVFKLKYYFKKLFRIYDKKKVNRVCHEYYSCSNAHCLCSDYPVDYQVMRRSTAESRTMKREPLLAEKLINSINSIVLGETEREDIGKGGAEATALVHPREYMPRVYDSLSSKPRKIDPNYTGIYPKENSILLILLEIRNKVRTAVGKFQFVLSLAIKFVLGIFDMLRVIFSMLKTRAVKGYGSVGVKLVNRLRLASSKLSKLFMCRSTHYYMVDKHEGRESKNKPTTRESCSTRSKARRIKHKQNSKQSTEALPRKTQEREEGSGEATMKVVCPICNRIGYLEKHGAKYRIRHYIKYEQRRRIYEYHYISEDQVNALGINEETGYKRVGIKRLDLASVNRMEWAGSLARIGRKPPKLVVVGSNPTPPATAELLFSTLLTFSDFFSVVDVGI